MKLIESVNELAVEFMNSPQYVMLHLEHMAALAAKMLETGIKPFPSEEDPDLYITCWKELFAGAINYCYWYGSHNIRPNNASSTRMYELVDQIFAEGFGMVALEARIRQLQELLSLNRFPMLEERCKHLKELEGVRYFMVDLVNSKGENFYPYLETLVERFPGYGSDMFLKRASLFFLQLHRKLGWFEDAMQVLPVPADYQVPKMLRHFGCFAYLDPLKTMVENGELIPKGSRMECEIRAATIVVCRFLQIQLEWNISEIDSWLWLRRKEATEPFHLTITTDY